MPGFSYVDLLPLGKDETQYRLLTSDYVSTGDFEGAQILKIRPEALRFLARQAMRDVSFLLPTGHLEKLGRVLDDPQASVNDRMVALTLLENAEISSQGVLPLCQDTGTATILAHKGQQVWTGVKDEEYLSRGVYDTYTEENLRYSQNIALTTYEEMNSGNNLPALIDIQAGEGMSYQFFFMAKGGGSSNKTMLFQETKAILNPQALEAFLIARMKTLGTSACPPYYLAFVIGGLSPEMCLKTAKLAGSGYLDSLPTAGRPEGRAFRDLELEQRLMDAAAQCGFGAQFGGKYFALSARVVRLPRHGGSCPIGMAVSCSAHRSIRAKIDREGLWLEELERNPGRHIPERHRNHSNEVDVMIDLNQPMDGIRKELSQHPIRTSVSLTGTIIVGRDIAHAKIKERLEQGQGLPQYLKDHPIYYAGPAKTPPGMASGSFGPTTAGRMDSYVDLFQAHGGSLVMIAKGNRSRNVVDSCQKNGGFYLGSIGGGAAYLARENIKNVEVLEFPELGMEAVWKIEVSDFKAFILIDDKGNDFYEQIG